jgi:hypothetical protein
MLAVVPSRRTWLRGALRRGHDRLPSSSSPPATRSPRSRRIRTCRRGTGLLGDLHRHDRGYGHILPKRDGGQLIAAAVMITGIGFVAVITAAVAEPFLAASRTEQGLADEVAELRGRMDRLES